MKEKLFSFTVITCLCIIPLGCSPSSDKIEGVHPDFDRLPPAQALDHSLDVSKRKDTPLPDFFKPDRLKYIATIGNDSTLANEFYERPPALDIDPKGNIYIVQSPTNSIRVYDKSGTFIYKIGQGGNGPGEFRMIGKFVFNKDYTKLYVLDVFEIEVFTLNNGRFEHETQIPHHFMRVYDMCRLDDILFVGGYKIDESDDREIVSPPVTKIDLKNYEHLRSFGYEYKSYSERGLYSGILSATMLSCNENTNTVVGYLKRYPHAFGYDTTGRPKWVSKIDGYMSTRSEEVRTSEGTVAFYPFMNEEMFNWKYDIQEIDYKEYSLLQFSYSPLTEFYETSDSRRIKNPIRTILVNTNTGELFYSDMYKYIGAWKDKIVITMAINPKTLNKTFQINELQ